MTKPEFLLELDTLAKSLNLKLVFSTSGRIFNYITIGSFTYAVFEDQDFNKQLESIKFLIKKKDPETLG